MTEQIRSVKNAMAPNCIAVRAGNRAIQGENLELSCVSALASDLLNVLVKAKRFSAFDWRNTLLKQLRKHTP